MARELTDPIVESDVYDIFAYAGMIIALAFFVYILAVL